jgi:hypothetical protein
LSLKSSETFGGVNLQCFDSEIVQYNIIVVVRYKWKEHNPQAQGPIGPDDLLVTHSKGVLGLVHERFVIVVLVARESVTHLLGGGFLRLDRRVRIVSH